MKGGVAWRCRLDTTLKIPRYWWLPATFDRWGRAGGVRNELSVFAWLYTVALGFALMGVSRRWIFGVWDFYEPLLTSIYYDHHCDHRIYQNISAGLWTCNLFFSAIRQWIFLQGTWLPERTSIASKMGLVANWLWFPGRATVDLTRICELDWLLSVMVGWSTRAWLRCVRWGQVTREHLG